jgi:hypothetical protein
VAGRDVIAFDLDYSARPFTTMFKLVGTSHAIGAAS